jgi:glucan endo-1,3-alpha-glucosidase
MRNRSGISGWRLGTLVLWLSISGSSRAAAPHFVFAHYMVCFATYGENVDAYKREIQEAQAAGIDGFALNVGAWSGPDTYYKNRVKLMYDAAESLQTGFKLFFSVEITNTTDIVDMVKTYANRTNTFLQGNRVVVSTFGQNNLDWSNSVFAPLKTNGISICFVPHFWPNPVQELPGFSDAVNILQKYRGLVDGLFLFGAAGLPAQLAQCNSNYTRAVHQAGKIFMASVTPHYWGAAQYTIGRRYFEFDGGEGIALQWNSIMQNQPDWVEITTWNDFNESTYIAPIENPAQYESQLQTPVRYSHKGYFELFRYYIAWFKTGNAPAVNRAALFFSYRTHPKNAVASNPNDLPTTWFIGDVGDTIYTTLFLPASAELDINSGGITTTNAVTAGIKYVRTPFFPGAQTFSLKRNGTELLSVQGPAIRSSIQTYDFFPATGYAYSTNPILSPPANFHIEPAQ